MLLGFFGLTFLEDSLWQGFAYSPFTAVFFGVEWLWQHIGWSTLILIAPALVGTKVWVHQRRRYRLERAKFAMSINSVGILSSMAIFEEQWFREGSENWNGMQRLKSCFAFGFAHMANLFSPLSTILPLSLGGYLFMRVYLKEYSRTGSRSDAILEASLVHRVYNRVALLAAFLSVGYLSLAALLNLPVLAL